MTKNIFAVFVKCFALLFLVLGGCKEVAIQAPEPPKEDDFTVPQFTASGATVRLSLSDDSKSTVYAGQPFVVKVSLYGMTKNSTASLWAATCDFALPSNIKVEKIVPNLDLFKVTGMSETLPMVYIDPANNVKAAYGLVYTRGSTPDVPDQGVLCNLVCVATLDGGSTTASVTLDSASVKATLKTVLKTTQLDPNTNPGISLPYAFVPLQFTVSNEFGGF